MFAIELPLKILQEIIKVVLQILEEGGAAEVHRRNSIEQEQPIAGKTQDTIFRSLSETLDDDIIDKLLDQFLASAANEDDERKQKVKAASIINLLTDDLIEQFATSDKVTKTKKRATSQKVEGGRPTDEL